jgi:hypothetical protein
MIAIHPTPTASDGRIIEQSHYIKQVDRLDDMIECAQCGFIIDLTKRSTGDSLGAIPSGGAIQKTQTFTPPRGVSFTDQFADPVDTKSGCPFCNTLNPKAIGRGRTGFERPHESVENL